MSDYYRILQVTREADQEVIERAYKALSLKYHPDRRPAGENARATREMQAINEAYAVLRDPKRRRRYDATLPPEGAGAWDLFWEQGLLGMFREKYRGGLG
jgi:molecular chaperone DnaJ